MPAGIPSATISIDRNAVRFRFAHPDSDTWKRLLQDFRSTFPGIYFDGPGTKCWMSDVQQLVPIWNWARKTYDVANIKVDCLNNCAIPDAFNQVLMGARSPYAQPGTIHANTVRGGATWQQRTPNPGGGAYVPPYQQQPSSGPQWHSRSPGSSSNSAPPKSAFHDQFFEDAKRAKKEAEDGMADLTMDEQVENAYRLFHLMPSAHLWVVEAVYTAAAKQYHPDRATDERDRKSREKKMAKINGAIGILRKALKPREG